MNGSKVECDGGDRGSMLAEALKLRMALIAFRPASQHCLREQRFAPEGDEAFRVQIGRVQAPEAHYLRFAGSIPFCLIAASARPEVRNPIRRLPASASFEPATTAAPNICISWTSMGISPA